MSSGAFNVGLTALRATQQALATTGHNIANANTDGYSRQRVEFDTRPAQFVGVGFLGRGVEVEGIVRLSSQYLVDQLRTATSNETGAAKTSELVNTVDASIGHALVAESIGQFFAAVGDANDDPQIMATRQVLIENAESVLARFGDQEQELNATSRSVNQQMSIATERVNTLTAAIATINGEIVRSSAVGGGAPANDLLDSRERLLQDLAELVGVQVQPRGDGMINVAVGSGAMLVTGEVQTDLVVQPNALDVSRFEIGVGGGAAFSQLTAAISGGELGALIGFRDATLEPTRNAIGRIAASFAMTVNAAHRNGMDMDGAMGGDLFSFSGPRVAALATNTGSITVDFDPNNIDQLTAADYRMRHDGTDFVLTNLLDGTTQTLSGAGPFNVDGVTITLTGAPAAGDEYMIQPTKFFARSLEMTTNDPRALALAAPIRTRAELANISDASVSAGQVLDPTDANLLNTVQLVFNDPPTTYQVNGAGPLLPFTSGADIDVNGWRVQVTGTPVAGDRFTIESNAGGVGDNRNGLELAALQYQSTMLNGTASYQESYGILLGEVGAAANQARISSDALSTLRASAEASRDAISGVNLDEEAANLLKFQQAYEAAARIISAADTTFRALLEMTG